MASLSARACTVFVFAAGLFAPSVAAASDTGHSFNFEGFATAWRNEPLNLTDSTRPDLIGLHVPVTGFAALAGAGFEWDWGSQNVVARMGILRWRHGVTGGGDGTAVANETTYDVRPASLDVFELGLPLPLTSGLAIRSSGESTRFELGLAWGWAWAFGSARVTDPTTNADQQLSASASSPFLRMDLRGCARLGAERWGCVTLAPDLYEFGWVPGASVGLKVDL